MTAVNTPKDSGQRLQHECFYRCVSQQNPKVRQRLGFMGSYWSCCGAEMCRYGCATRRRKSPSKLSRNPLPSQTLLPASPSFSLISDAALMLKNFAAVWNQRAPQPPPFSHPRWRPSAGIRIEGLTFSPLISPDFSATTPSLAGAKSDLFSFCYQQHKHDEANEGNVMTPLETHSSHFYLERRL